MINQACIWHLSWNNISRAFAIDFSLLLFYFYIWERLCVCVPFGVDRFMILKTRRGLCMPQQFSLYINKYIFLICHAGGYIFIFIAAIFFCQESERNSSCNLFSVRLFWRWYFTFQRPWTWAESGWLEMTIYHVFMEFRMT